MTAVEWLYNHLFPKQLDGFSDEEWNKIDLAFKQAKEMEEDGKHESYLYGHKVGFTKAKEIEAEEKKNNQSKSSEPYLH